MEQLLDRAGNAYDYVLIDLPPVLAVTDAALLDPAPVDNKSGMNHTKQLAPNYEQ